MDRQGEISATERLKRVRLLAMDVDGVLTDGAMIFGPSGDTKIYSAVDGLGISLALEIGLPIVWITGNTSSAVASRAESIGVKDVYQGARYKTVALHDIASRRSLGLDEIAYIGDDLNDLPAIEAAGVSFAVANASPEVKAAADFVTERCGGSGAVREVIEKILKAQDRWDDGVSAFLARLKAEQESGQAPGAIA